MNIPKYTIEEFSKYSWEKTTAFKSSAVPKYLNCLEPYSADDIYADQSLLIGEFKSNENSSKALLISNASELNNNRKANVSLSATGAKHVYAYLNGVKTELTAKNGKYTFTLPCGGGTFLIIE